MRKQSADELAWLKTLRAMGAPSDKKRRSTPTAAHEASSSHHDAGNTNAPGTDPTETGAARSELREPESLIGSQLGRYQITQVLGRGGMGIVYRGTDPSLEREVAIKVLDRELSREQTSLKRFVREARAAAKLSHAHTIPVFEVGQEGETHFIVMEFARGGSVDDQLKRGFNYSPQDAARLIAQACKGLSAAHSAGLIHRDIKPGNLLLTEDGTLKVGDFGLVKQADRESMATTQKGAILGSPHYMSPEQFDGNAVDGRSDIYSLGATYFALLTGKPPYHDADGLPQMIYSHTQKDIPDPRALNSDLPEACSMIVRRAMAKSPSERYQSAEAMLADLSNLTNVETATTSSPISRRVLLGAAVMGMLAVIGGLLFTVRSGQDHGARNANEIDSSSPEANAAVPANADPIKVGLLWSLRGETAAREEEVAKTIEFALSEITSQGGLLGRPIEVVVGDGQDDGQIAQREAKRLVEDEGVSVIFGGWTSPTRKSIGTVVRALDHLLICPIRYGGLEQLPNVAYIGALPNQQMFPAVEWAIKQGRKRFFLVGSDAYEYPHLANLVLREAIKRAEGEVVGETYLPLGNHGSDSVVQAVLGARADCILSTIQGDSNIGFFRALRGTNHAADQIITLSFSITDDDLAELDLSKLTNDYLAQNYLQNLDNDLNREFVQRVQDGLGAEATIGAPAASAYAAVQLWARTVEEQQSALPVDVRKGLATQSVATPVGELALDAKTRHAFRSLYVAKINETGNHEVVWQTSEPIAPDPYPFKTEKEWLAELDGFRDVEWRFLGNEKTAPAAQTE